MNSHQDEGLHSEVKPSSNRTFGLVFSAIFLIFGIWSLLYLKNPAYWAFWLALGFFLLAIFLPKLLTKLNFLWFKVGLMLHKLVSPLVMGLLFFCVLTPTGLLMRIFGQRPLSLGFKPKVKSYWIDRTPPGPDPKTMTNQF